MWLYASIEEEDFSPAGRDLTLAAELGEPLELLPRLLAVPRYEYLQRSCFW
jgi:hypothetical protein